MPHDSTLKISAEIEYLRPINKIMFIILCLHLPFIIYLAFVFNTGILFSILSFALIASLPTLLLFLIKNEKLTSIVFGIAYISISGLIIHLTKGMIEAHFHIFVSIAALIIFADPLVILSAALTAAIHHIGFYFFLPASVFNYKASFLIVAVHAFFVILETIPCMYIANLLKSYVINQGLIVANISTLSSSMITSIENLNKTNTELNISAESQSSAVSQTTEATQEIKFIANQTSDNAESSMKKSEDGKDFANNGKEAVDEMNVAFNKIRNSNEEVLDQIHKSNNELNEIVQIIKQIENKAQIINEIVFQTKLLSFNASVEAARAGENGKGFAVVAEEVGNLAKMSGNASKEISDLINTSVQKVENIAASNDTKINELVSNSHINLNEGNIKLELCSDILSKLVTSSSEINLKLKEIFSAAKEQSNGINEINNALLELDKLNSTNTSSIKSNLQISMELKQMSDNLSNLILQLNQK